MTETSSTIRRTIVRTLKDWAKARGLNVAQVGRDTEAPAIEPRCGLFFDTGLYSKPPRLLVHLRREKGRMCAALAPHAQAGRLGYINTRAGRHVGAVVVRVMAAFRAGPNQWRRVQGVEWLLVVARSEPIPDGSSSSTLDHFDPDSGQLTYQDQPLEYDFLGLVGVCPGSTLIPDITGGTAVTYAEVSTALQEWLHANPRGASTATPVSSYDGCNTNDLRKFRTALSNLRTRQFNVEESARRIRALVAEHNKHVHSAALSAVREYDAENAKQLAEGLVDAMGGRVSEMQVMRTPEATFIRVDFTGHGRGELPRRGTMAFFWTVGVLSNAMLEALESVAVVPHVIVVPGVLAPEARDLLALEWPSSLAVVEGERIAVHLEQEGGISASSVVLLGSTADTC